MTIFEHIMRTMHVATPTVRDRVSPGRPSVIVFRPAPIEPLTVRWTFEPDRLIQPWRSYGPRVIQIVWPRPRRMRCGKWRASGKVYRTEALAWRGLEKRGLRP